MISAILGFSYLIVLYQMLIILNEWFIVVFLTDDRTKKAETANGAIEHTHRGSNGVGQLKDNLRYTRMHTWGGATIRGYLNILSGMLIRIDIY